MKHKNHSLGKDLQIQTISTNFISIVDADKLNEHNKKRTLYFACISFDRVKKTCKWCMLEHGSQYELEWGNRYNKWAYDSEECRNADAISRGWIVNEAEEED